MKAQRQASSLTHDLLYATRYYMWRPRVLVTLAAIAIVTGLALNWSWLVAAGLAPLLISTLPCLVMCAFGVCMFCRSREKHSAPVRDAAEVANPLTRLAAAATNKPSIESCSSLPLSSQALPLLPRFSPRTGATTGRCGAATA